MKVDLTALKAFTYGGQSLSVGKRFRAPRADAKILIAIGKAVQAGPELPRAPVQPAPVVVPPPVVVVDPPPPAELVECTTVDSPTPQFVEAAPSAYATAALTAEKPAEDEEPAATPTAPAAKRARRTYRTAALTAAKGDE